jgi:hypothetical protein
VKKSKVSAGKDGVAEAKKRVVRKTATGARRGRPAKK